VKLPTLRPYQVDSLNAICAARASGLNRILIKKPTGTGKTVTFASLLRWPAMAEWLETFPSTERHMLVIAHREELIDQALEKIQRQNPGLMVSVEQGPRYSNRYSDVVVASIQTLAAQKFKRLKDLLRQHKFRIVIVDEAHHAAAASYRTALVHLGFLPPADASDSDEIEAVTVEDVAMMAKNLEQWDVVAPKDRLLVGFTATPNRSDAVGLACVFQSIAYSYGLKQAIDDNWLVPIVPWVVETKTSIEAVGVNRGDFNQKELGGAVNNYARNALLVESWMKFAREESTIVFSAGVEHAHDIAAAFTAVGVQARAISGKTPSNERRAVLAAYSRGDVQVVINAMLLTEGTDLPRTACIVHGAPTQSSTLYEQKTGRGLRLYPGKTECIVIDLVDVTRRHSLQTAPMLYGLPPTLKPIGKNLRELEDEFAAFLEKHPGFTGDGLGRKTMEELNAYAMTFDIWKLPELGDFANGRKMKWSKVGDAEYLLQYPWLDGTEILKVARDLLSHFAVSLTFRPKEGAVRQRTLAMEIESATKAAEIAETFVLSERKQVARMRSLDAPWRSKAMSPGQRDLLNRLRVAFKPGITAGEASDLIDQAQCRKASGR